MIKNICIFDTRINSTNQGNNIIAEACDRFMHDIFQDAFFINIPYLDNFGNITMNNISNSDMVILYGTNALSSKMNRYKQIGLDLFNSFKVNKRILLFGVGWWQYQELPNFYTKLILRNSLSNKYIHSVRDEYTVKMLKSIGITNVLNTGCPTLWCLNEQKCSSIPKKSSNKVIFTLTDYNKNIQLDRKLIETLQNAYKEIYFWIQGIEDYTYIKYLINEYKYDIKKIIPPNLNCFDIFLENNDVDYVGTRLHAGIRALQHGKRTIIIGIDNRAIEMYKDFNLPVIFRENIGVLDDELRKTLNVNINLPVENIQLWKEQFSNIEK